MRTFAALLMIGLFSSPTYASESGEITCVVDKTEVLHLPTNITSTKTLKFSDEVSLTCSYIIFDNDKWKDDRPRNPALSCSFEKDGRTVASTTALSNAYYLHLQLQRSVEKHEVICQPG